MARKTSEQLQQELEELKKNYEQAVQVQKNCQDRAIAIDAILKDREEIAEESVKKSIAQ